MVLLGLASSPARASREDTLAGLRTRGVFRWGGDVQGGEPYVFQSSGGVDGLAGFEVDLAEALARRLGVRAEFVQNDWQTLIPSLERGDFDVAMNGIEVTTARRARVAFTRPYYAFTETLVVRRGERAVEDLGDLRGRRVGTLDGSLALDLLARDPSVEIVRYEGVEEPYLDLERGRLDAVLLDNIIADRYGLPRPTLRAAGTVGEGVYAIALRPDDRGLLAAVDGALADLIQAGELRAILERWRLWDARQDALTEGRPVPRDLGPTGTLSPVHLALFLRGAGFTVVISTLAMALAVAGGLAISLIRRHGSRLPRAAAAVYVEVLRGTPVLLQLYVLYYGLAPVLTLDAFSAAVIGLGLNYAAYESELYRAGWRCAASSSRRRSGWRSPAWPTTSSRCSRTPRSCPSLRSSS